MRNTNLLPPVLCSLALASSVFGAAPTAPSVNATGDLCTGGKASGTGLRGAYYSSAASPSPPALVRLDASVSSDTLRRLPARLSASPPRQVRWCGWIRPVASGVHRFSTGAQPLKIEIGKQIVAGPGAKVASVQLEAGTPYAIRIELADVARSGEFVLQWTPPFGVTYDIPPTVLFPPLETTDPGC